MAFRITTNGLMRSYRTSLGKVNAKVYDTMERVQTTRNFSTSAEDPAAASKAFQLRRSYWRAQDHIDNTKYLLNKLQMGWSSTDAVVDGDGHVPVWTQSPPVWPLSTTRLGAAAYCWGGI